MERIYKWNDLEDQQAVITPFLNETSPNVTLYVLI